jgi:uncharacterized protein (DUF488 family)
MVYIVFRTRPDSSETHGKLRGTVFTVGHSTHELAEFVSLLGRNGVTQLADVRTVPRSRRMPHFSRENLVRSLPAAGIEYAHLAELGGFRRPRPDSPNAGWRHEGFRGYADHMESADFAAGMTALESMAADRPTATMCAEALWQRCHRRLIADALTARGWTVVHIGSDGRTQPHELTPFAVVEGGRVTYPPEQAQFDIHGGEWSRE